MTQIKRLHLRIPGEFRDIWLYKGHVYAWGRDGVLFMLELDRIFEHVVAIHGPDIANLANVLIFRNDWKFGQQFRNFMRSPAMESAFLKPLTEADTLTLTLPFGMLRSSDSEKYGGVVLDTTIYADHVFLATADGLLQSFIDPTDPDFVSGINQHDDNRATGVTVRYGAINVSAEDRGLLFGSIHHRSFEEHKFYKSTLSPVADYSRHTSFAERDLLDYTSTPAPRLLRAKVVERELSPRTQEKYQVTGYQEPEQLDALTYAAATTKTKVSNRIVRQASYLRSSGNAEVIGNSNNHLLVAWNGHLRVISMSVEPGPGENDPDEIQAGPTRGYKPLLWDEIRPNDILQTLPIRSGFVVEFPESVGLITKEGSFNLSNEPVAQLRTFANSKQFKDVVAAVEESYISLTGYYIIDETLF